MRAKITSNENLSRDVEWGWHGRAPRYGGTVPIIWQNGPKPTKQHRRATWLTGRLCRFSVARLCYPCLTPRDFRATLGGLFRGFKFTSLALHSAKCCPSFCFFDKVPENTERRYMSKMYTKGG